MPRLGEIVEMVRCVAHLCSGRQPTRQEEIYWTGAGARTLFTPTISAAIEKKAHGLIAHTDIGMSWIGSYYEETRGTVWLRR